MCQCLSAELWVSMLCTVEVQRLSERIALVPLHRIHTYFTAQRFAWWHEHLCLFLCLHPLFTGLFVPGWVNKTRRITRIALGNRTHDNAINLDGLVDNQKLHSHLHPSPFGYFSELPDNLWCRTRELYNLV